MSDRCGIRRGGNDARHVLLRIDDEYQIDISVRPSRGPGLSLVFEGQRNVLRLAEGDFATTVVRATANTQVSPWLSARTTCSMTM